MKRTLIKLLAFLACIISLLLACGCSLVSIEDTNTAKIYFIYGENDITENLTDEETEIIQEMFNKKATFLDNPSCGFGKNVSIVINGDTFCMAHDTCAFVYHMNKDMYFKLSDEEYNTIVGIFENHGGYFPCV